MRVRSWAEARRYVGVIGLAQGLSLGLWDMSAGEVAKPGASALGLAV